MRDDLFSIPIRKYHIDDDQTIVDFALKQYVDYKFELPSPFIFGIGEVPPDITQTYSDLLEEFLTDLKLYNTHVVVVTSFTLKVLEDGESTDRVDTLPSHYTAVHYVDVPEQSTSDVFHHPARSMLNAFRPAEVDEWKEAAGVYVNPGDVIIHPSFMEASSPVAKGKRVTMTLTFVIRENEQGRESNTEKSAA